MKFVLLGLAVVAAVAALFFRPPHDSAPPNSPNAFAAVSAPPSIASRVHTAVPSVGPPHILVYVAGEVGTPGVYALPPGARAQDALRRAGGAKADADLIAVNLAAPVEDGAEIVFPKVGEAPARGRARVPRARASHTPRGRGRRQHRAPPSSTRPSVDLNSADADELETLPGIGPALAARIVAYRETNGPFTSVDELADVSGITPRLQEQLADVVIVH